MWSYTLRITTVEMELIVSLKSLNLEKGDVVEVLVDNRTSIPMGIEIGKRHLKEIKYQILVEGVFHLINKNYLRCNT